MIDKVHEWAHGKCATDASRAFMRRAWWLACLWVMFVSGCASTVPTPDPYRLEPPPETFSAPLPFGAHNFWGYCFNATDCHIDYDKFDFGVFESHGDPGYIFPPPMGDIHRRLSMFHRMGIRNFPKPAQLSWKSLDGERHETKVDLATIFREKRTWHRVPPDDMKDFWRGPSAPPPDIFMEVDDRTVNVYITMFIPTVRLQEPGNIYSGYRHDYILAWSRTF